MKTIAVVPMREHSTRMKDKNVLEIAGRPVLAWALDEVRDCKYIKKIVAVTESQRLAEYARYCGIEEVIMTTDPAMSDGKMPAGHAVAHAVRVLEGRGERYDAVSEFYACVPVVPRGIQTLVIERLMQGDCDEAHAVVSCPLMCQSGTVDAAGRFTFLNTDWIEPDLTRRVDLYHPTGAAQVCTRDFYVNATDWKQQWKKRFAAVISNDPTVDIDSPLDVEMATFFLSRRPYKKHDGHLQPAAAATAKR